MEKKILRKSFWRLHPNTYPSSCIERTHLWCMDDGRTPRAWLRHQPRHPLSYASQHGEKRPSHHGRKRMLMVKIRKYYATTELGKSVLHQAREKAYEMFKEIKD